MTLDLFSDAAEPNRWFVQLDQANAAQQIDGLVIVDGYDRNGRPPEEVATIEKARFYKAHSVFFEVGRNGRAPVPQAFVFVSRDGGDDEEFADLHKRLWSWGGVPLLYRRTPGQIQLFRCAHDPDFISPTGEQICKPFRFLDIGSRIAATEAWWDAERIRNGTLWDDPNACRLMLSAQKAAHRKLVEAVRDLNDELSNKRLLTAGLRRRLLILSLLIAYLEERGVLGPDFFGRFLKDASRFFEVLRDGAALVEMLKALEDRFNGHVFALKDDEAGALKSSRQLARFASLVEGYEDAGGQLSFWRLYSFKDLPVELISHIYQLFVTDTDSSVYTPPTLVRLMLDEALSWDRIDRLMASREIVLDPACGSGVFLVEAYKRLVLHWRSRNDWAKPGVDELRTLLDRVHGIDLEAGAVELAAFSLCLALCDALEPEEIRASVKLFPKLADASLHKRCFFEAKEEALIKAPVGVLVGNPPFESSLTTPAAKRAYAAYVKQHGKLADQQVAYLFLHEAMGMTAEGGVLSMIQPSGFLYNQHAGEFRESFFKRWNVREILDFVSVRGLFKKGEADPKVVIVVALSEPANPASKLLHAVFRRNGRANAEQGFEIDYYDLHRVPHAALSSNSDLWRANLLGGDRLLSFVQRLRKYRTLGEYATERGWNSGEGYIAGQKGISRPAEHIVGQRLLPTKALSSKGLDASAITKVPKAPIKDPKSEARFTPPILLMKEHQDLYHAMWEESYLTYKHEIVGFAAPKGDLKRLRLVRDWIATNAPALQAYVAGTSIRLFTQRATSIASADIMALPYPEDGSLDLSMNERILIDDVVRYGRDFVRKGSDSDVMKLDGGQALPAFAESFTSQISTVYANKPLRALEAQRWPGIICQPFVFGVGKVDWTGVGELRGRLDSLLREKRGSSIAVTRIARIYDRNFVFLLKPDRLRYWLRSTALRDADDVLADLRAQGF
ncbi:N-6 DNA methylase [Hyphomicrobium denitrificans ATCC 51888]|uniref:site-specific DNA-methyltransferase (adenine-specific) n=1 Tax=Hyphomicrobium denitrificans (strain ATCC 51888 / DSM 1869 / NCIMB 11706 / TK 0415) TaxID=582899 RepID=D8JRF0_HYPDA|nr:N-6 DNA methylase [Hyphomicrobium denitrificans]ADJ22179.1 N-6 DNA methylase [Hyphomicrobium denitrificans ATCC 51888]